MMNEEQVLEEVGISDLREGDVFLHFSSNEKYAVAYHVLLLGNHLGELELFYEKADPKTSALEALPLSDLAKDVQYYREVKTNPDGKHQVGGKHYSVMKIQPVEYIMANKLSFPVGNIIKYVSRYDKKNNSIELQIEDLEKSKQYLDLMIEELRQKKGAINENNRITNREFYSRPV